MRGLWILLVMAAFAAGAMAQPTADEKPRFGIAPNFDLYPQNTPKAALETATKLLENRRYDYFVAHVLDPVLLESKIRERAERLEKEVELQLLQKRDEQKLAPDSVTARERLPIEPKAFAAIVRDEAVNRSFKYVVRDLQAQLEGTENRITVACNRYIRSVQDYNVTVRTFPSNFTAMVFGYKDIPNFSVENEKEISKPPSVSFNTAPAAPKGAASGAAG